MKRTIAVLATLATITAAPAHADKCLSARLKAIAKKERVLLACRARVAAKGEPALYALCRQKAVDKFNAAFGKTTGCAGTLSSCEANADDCNTKVTAQLPDAGPSQCEFARLMAAGKKASAKLGCYARAALRSVPVDGVCLARATSRFNVAWAKTSGCSGVQEIVEDTVDAECVGDLVTTDGSGNVTDICHGPTSSTTSTTAAATTTTTTTPVCNCCSKTTLKFTSTIGGVGDCGDIRPGGCAAFNSGGAAGTPCTDNVPCGGGTCMKDITCGGLYFGGGIEGVPLPATPPDMGQNVTRITGCNSATGAFNLTNTTITDTGSLLTCTSGPGAGSGICSAGNCTQGGANGGHACTSNAQCGCLFGAPVPLPNPNSPSTSACLINSVTTNAAGTGSCGGSIANLALPINSEVYLTGDGMPKRCNAASGTNQGRQCLNNGNCPGGACVTDSAIQPCPICNETTGLCNGGADDGLPCTPGTSGSGVLGPGFPTSHDCRPNPPSSGGVAMGFNFTTGTQTKVSANLGPQPGQQAVFTGCGGCATTAGAFEGPPTHSCNSNSDCTNGSFTVCRQRANGAFANPIATSITATGSPAACLADGAPHAATLASVICVPHTGSIFYPDSPWDVPGPGAITMPEVLQAQ